MRVENTFAYRRVSEQDQWARESRRPMLKLVYRAFNRESLFRLNRPVQRRARELAAEGVHNLVSHV